MRFGQLRGQAARGAPDMFITVTWRIRDGVTPDEAAAALANAWRNAVKRLERKWRRPHIEYLAIFERTKLGWPHLHILARAKFIPQKWLSRTMDELCGSPIVDVRRINSTKQALAYVTKYVGKEAARFGTCKRYWFTRKYRSAEDLPKERQPGWWHFVTFTDTRLDLWKAGLLRHGWLLSAETANAAEMYYPRQEAGP